MGVYEEMVEAFRSGDNDRTRILSARSLEAADASGDPSGQVDALCMLARVALRDGDFCRVRELAEEARARARTAGKEGLEQMLAFALRRDFPWWRVPGYVIVQLIGATLAALVLHAVINVSAVHGSNYVASGFGAGAGFWMELLLTFGLVSVILGTASGAQNIGIIAALGVGAYIALAGLWGSPISGASMNPARTFGSDLVGGKFTDYWVYIAGPIAGAAVAVAVAFVLRGPGGGLSGSGAAQGALLTEAEKPDKR